MKDRRHIIAGMLAAITMSSLACTEVLVCTSEGPKYEVTPPQIDLAVGLAASVSVTEITCSGRHRVMVYPVMSIVDTTVASVNTFYRQVLGRAAGTTTLQFEPPGPGPIVQVPVVVR